MPTATPTENSVVQEYYKVMDFIGGSEFQETKQGTLYLMNEKQLKSIIVETLLRAYDLGQLRVMNKEKESNFGVKDYLIRD